MNLRNKVFWVIDKIKGNKIKSHLENIKEIMEHSIDNKKQLDTLLKHAVNTTAFYQKYINRQKEISISQFPVISKRDIKENYEDFQSSKYKDAPVHYMSTSGSTGTPFTIKQDMNKRNRVLAELIYFNEIIGQEIGDKFIFFRVWTDKNKKSKLEQIKQNLVPIDILYLDDSNLQKIRQLLKKDKDVITTLGYASTYEHLVNYISRYGDTTDMFHLKTMVTSSEVLELTIKQKIKNILGCQVIDRYSNQENGVIAQTTDCSEEFIVNRASYYVELLKLDSNEPVEVGEIGRIVITDIYNFAMPMVRYDTGDLAIKEETQEDGSVRILRSIQGRRVDVIYDTKGNRLTPHTWSVYMWKFDKLQQYQFIQEGAKSYTLKVSGAKGLYSAVELETYLKTILGEDAEIEILFVESIPVLASGKFKKTVCNYIPNNAIK